MLFVWDLCALPRAILLSLFTGAGSSARTKPKPKRAKVINTIMCEDGVQRDKTALKEQAEYAVRMKQKSKEEIGRAHV